MLHAPRQSGGLKRACWKVADSGVETLLSFISIPTVCSELLAALVAESLRTWAWLNATNPHFFPHQKKKKKEKTPSFEYHMVSGVSYGYIYALWLYPLS